MGEAKQPGVYINVDLGVQAPDAIAALVVDGVTRRPAAPAVARFETPAGPVAVVYGAASDGATPVASFADAERLFGKGSALASAVGDALRDGPRWASIPHPHCRSASLRVLRSELETFRELDGAGFVARDDDNDEWVYLPGDWLRARTSTASWLLDVRTRKASPGWSRPLPLPDGDRAAFLHGVADTRSRPATVAMQSPPYFESVHAWWYETQRLRRAVKRYSALTDGPARCPTARQIRRDIGREKAQARGARG